MVREVKVFAEVITLLTRDARAGSGVVRREGNCRMERNFRSPGLIGCKGCFWRVT